MIRGILFDKDGTLIDFYALWLAAARKVIPEFVKCLLDRGKIPVHAVKCFFGGGLEKELFISLGVYGDKVDSRGALAWKTYPDIGKDMNVILRSHGIYVDDDWVAREIERRFREYADGPEAVQRPVADLPKLLTELKSKGIYIGLATSDTKECAEHCLDSLGIYDYFDYVGADDRTMAPKPEPDMFRDFSKKFGLLPHQVAVVGDTWNDMFFAKRCHGVAIGVLSGTGEQEDFSGIADYVLNSVAELPEIL